MALTEPDTGPEPSIDGVPTGIRTPVTAVKGLGRSTWNNGLRAPCAESVLSERAAWPAVRFDQCPTSSTSNAAPARARQSCPTARHGRPWAGSGYCASSGAAGAGEGRVTCAGRGTWTGRSCCAGIRAIAEFDFATRLTADSPANPRAILAIGSYNNNAGSSR
jgi:hypothetical protein